MDILAALIGGVIATFSSVITLIVSHYIRQSGKLTIILYSSKITLFKSDQFGGSAPANDAVEAEGMNIQLGVDFYNSSDVPKSLRQPLVELKPKDKNHKVLIPTFERLSGGSSSELKVINIPPHEIKHLELTCWVQKDDISYIMGKVDINLLVSYPNSKKLTTHMSTVEVK